MKNGIMAQKPDGGSRKVKRDLIGIDIGGTKTAISVWGEGGVPEELRRFPTGGPDELLRNLKTALPRRLKAPVFGVACGGPLDAAGGRILSPPNLPGWDDVPLVTMLEAGFGGRAFLMNDANANAVAEWKFGAGRGTESMVFLTAGTGMGAGIIAGGQLLSGANGNAGEVGHVRLAGAGPVGFGKAGSFEGFCSGGGIRQLVRYLPKREKPPRAADWAARHPGAQDVILAAKSGDKTARAVLRVSGEKLGAALAVLVDILNPEKIVLGTLYRVARAFLEPSMRRTLEREALPGSLAACRIVPAKLGKNLGNYGAICAALYKANEWD